MGVSDANSAFAFVMVVVSTALCPDLLLVLVAILLTGHGTNVEDLKNTQVQLIIYFK